MVETIGMMEAMRDDGAVRDGGDHWDAGGCRDDGDHEGLYGGHEGWWRPLG